MLGLGCLPPGDLFFVFHISYFGALFFPTDALRNPCAIPLFGGRQERTSGQLTCITQPRSERARPVDKNGGDATNQRLRTPTNEGGERASGAATAEYPPRRAEHTEGARGFLFSLLRTHAQQKRQWPDSGADRTGVGKKRKDSPETGKGLDRRGGTLAAEGGRPTGITTETLPGPTRITLRQDGRDRHGGRHFAGTRGGVKKGGGLPHKNVGPARRDVARAAGRRQPTALTTEAPPGSTRITTRQDDWERHGGRHCGTDSARSKLCEGGARESGTPLRTGDGRTTGTPPTLPPRTRPGGWPTLPLHITSCVSRRTGAPTLERHGMCEGREEREQARQPGGTEARVDTPPALTELELHPVAPRITPRGCEGVTLLVSGRLTTMTRSEERRGSQRSI